MRIHRCLAVALGLSIVLNGALLVLCAPLLFRPTEVARNPTGARLPEPAAGTLREQGPSRVVTEGLPRGVQAILRGHHGWISECAYSPDGSLLAAVTDDGFLSIWEPSGASVQPKAEYGPEHLGIGGNNRRWALAFAPDGRSLAYSCNDSDKTPPEIQVIDIDSGKRRQIPIEAPVARFRLPATFFFCLAFAPDGKTLAAGGINGIDLYDTATGRSKGAFQSLFCRQLAYCKADSALLASSSQPLGIQVFELSSSQKVRSLKNPETVSGEPPSLAALGHQYFEGLVIAPDSSKAAAATSGNCTYLWDYRTGANIAAIHEGTGTGWAEGRCILGFTPDGASLLTASRGRKLLDKVFARRRDAETGELLYQTELVPPGEPFRHVYPIAISPRGRSLVCRGIVGEFGEGTGVEGVLAVYDLSRLFVDTELPGH